MAYKDPLVDPQIDIRRERILTEVKKVRKTSEEQPSPEQLTDLFNQAAFVSNKANVLAKAIADQAETFFIPVHEEATSVRTAVARKSADSPDGSQISFDLFRNAVEAMQRMRKDQEQIMIVGKSIYPDSVLSKRIRKTRARAMLRMSNGYDPDDDTLEMLISQFLILWIAHEMMRPFEGLDHYPIVAQLQHQGNPEAAIALQILLGVAIQLLIMGLNDDLAEFYLDQASGKSYPFGLSARDIIAQARNFEKTKAQEYAELQAGLSDYEVIINYSFDYIKRSIDPGLQMWVAYVDSVQMRYNAQSIWTQAPHYSVPHALISEGNKSRKKKKSGSKYPGDPDYDDRMDLELERSIIEGLVPMGNAAYIARQDALNGINDNLDVIAQVFSSDFAEAAVCCLARILGEIPEDTIRTLRAFLEGLMRGYAFDLSNIISAIQSHLTSPNFEEIIALEAMHQIDEIFDKLVDKLLGLFDGSVEPFLCCPLFGEMISKIIESIARLEAEMKGAVKIFAFQLVHQTGMGENDTRVRYEHAYESRILRKMIMILDAILRQAQSMKACAADNVIDVLPESVREAIALPTINIDDDLRTNYFTSALPRELSNGKFLPGLGEKIESLVRDPSTNNSGKIKGKHTCGTGFEDIQIQSIANAFTR